MIDVALQRLYNQQLVQTTCRTPAEVVSWLGAVQAQEYLHAKWALGLRLRGVTDAEIEPSFTDGSILRTHVMRPTWHFVTPADIRWMLALTAPRVHAVNAYMYRQVDLDAPLLERGMGVIVRALEGEHQLTRPELGKWLAEAGIQAEGFRLSYLMMYAELEGAICSGARRGKQFTYALLDERAPALKTLSREEALTELVRRYFTSHGPALIQDFVGWSGLTVADAKMGLEMANAELTSEDIDGRTYWFSTSMRDAPPLPVNTAFLLPVYDEYGIAYRKHDEVLDPAHLEQAINATFGGSILVDCQIVGNWRRTISKTQVLVELAPFRPLTEAELEAVRIAAQQLGEFLNLPVMMT